MSIRNIALWTVINIVAGATVFTVSHRVDAVRKELRATETSIVREQETIRVLDAEWAWLTRPERLQDLAQNLTDLQATNPKQLASVTRMTDLAMAGDPRGPSCVGLKPPPRKPTVGRNGFMLATMRSGGNEI